MINIYDTIQHTAKKLNVPFHMVEKDYCLSWVLIAISMIPTLKNTLVFKGGTALKKCYFEDYRFSEDLDFSVTGEYPTGKQLEKTIT